MYVLRIGVICLGFLLGGCAADRAQWAGERLYTAGKYEEAVKKLEEAMLEEPSSAKYRATYRVYKEQAINLLLRNASDERSAGNYDTAEKIFNRVLSIDSDNDKATAGLLQLPRDRSSAKMIDSANSALKAGETERATELLDQLESDGVTGNAYRSLKMELRDLQAKQKNIQLYLKPMYAKPVSLEFRNAPVGAVLEALTRSTGVNFILDRDVKVDLRTTVMLKETSVEEAIDFILQTSKLEKKILNNTTVLIYPSSQDKNKEYQDLLVQSFYLGRADVRQVQTNLKSLLGIKNMVVNEKLNLLIVRDTPETMKLVEKIVAMHDIFEPEVMLEVEVMEITRDRLTELGVDLPTTLSLSPLATGSSLTLSDLKHLNDSKIGATVGSTTLSLRRETSDVNTLANPRIRVKNHEKAKIMVGDKVPVVTSTTTSTGVISESVQYLDVGLKLEVEPTIYLQNEIEIKVGLEVSSITKEVTTSAGTLTYQMGNRSANTTLQLKDGETQILAGLINDDQSNTASKLPGLGDIPVIGRIFSSQKDEHNKSEIVLAITPRIVRPLNRPNFSNSVFWSGSEVYPKAKAANLSKSDSEAGSEQKPSGDVRNPATRAVGSEGADSMDGGQKEPSKVVLQWKGPNLVKVGENFTVDLYIESDGGLSTLPLQIGYDKLNINLLNIEKGDYFGQGDSEVVFSKSQDPNSGKAFVTVSRMAKKGAVGEGRVLSMTLHATAETDRATIKMLAISPVSVGQKSVDVAFPPDHVITVEGK